MTQTSAQRSPGSKPPLMIDITRSLRRMRHPVASGIDRVERRYIDWALSRGETWLLAAIGTRQFLVSPARAAQCVAALFGAETRFDTLARLQPWRDPVLRCAESTIRTHAIGGCRSEQLPLVLLTARAAPRVYLNLGHVNLSPDLMAALGRAGLQRFAMLHDTIPLDHPETCREGTVPRFRAMLEAMAMADGLLCNSEDTRRRGTGAFRHLGLDAAPMTVLPLGIDPVSTHTNRSGRSSFVMLGTIEPRKNHAMILEIWAQLWRDLPLETCPSLHIIGRRGWRNKVVFQILDTHPMMGRVVHLWEDLDDPGRDRLMAGATALLMPSLAEGYGLPVGEALACGSPVLASDLPAHREVGQGVPDYLDPDDPGAWCRAIKDYAAPASPRREAQLARLGTWRRPDWATHFQKLSGFMRSFLVEQPIG